MMPIPIHVVLAVAEDGGIGNAGTLPWPALPTDMKHFYRLTTTVRFPGCRNAVIMGRKTWDSIGRPLKGRLNIVVSSVDHDHDVYHDHDHMTKFVKSLKDALDILDSCHDDDNDIEQAFLIGGAQLLQTALDDDDHHNNCRDRIGFLYITHIHGTFPCDVFVSPTLLSFMKMFSQKVREQQEPMEENGVRFSFAAYRFCRSGRLDPSPMPMAAKVHEEYQYLGLIKDILATGTRRSDRTGTGTLSKFGCQMRFSLRDNVLPLLTTKRVFWRGVAEELLWFISGSTDARVLQSKDIHIWDGNSSKDFLEKRGFPDREEGDLGPVYGFQWRHFGAVYADATTDYKGQGVDQLQAVIRELKTDPTSRRIVMSAWNPVDLDKMALPPCHMFCQFYVDHDDDDDHDRPQLSCLMYQRSADMGLGVPFNIASYALLTRLIAHVVNMEAKELVHVIGDAHVYLTHVDALKEQVQRHPRPFPTLSIDDNDDVITNIDHFQMKHLQVQAYNPHLPLKTKMTMAI